MKILVITNMYPSNRDRVYGTFVKVFYDDLKCEFNNTELIAIKGKKHGISKLLAYIQFYNKVLYKLIFKKYDLVYVHTISHTSPPIRLASLLRTPNLVFNIHGDDLLTTTPVATTLRNISYPLLKNACLIVVPTQYFKEVLLEKCPWITNEKIFISPSGGLNKSFYDNSEKPYNSTPIIGYVSRIDKGKGWEYLIDAIDIIIKKGIKVNVLMVGSGSQEQDLKNKITTMHLNERIRFVGSLTHKELPEFYHILDWFVFPTYRDGESLGLVGLEAMAACTPVIGSNIAGLKSYIINNENGYLVSPQNSLDIACALEKALLLTEFEKKSFQRNAYNTALKYESSLVNKKLFNRLKILANK